MSKITLTLDALESREVPAFIGLVKGGPQPEPPTVLTNVAFVKVEPPPPVKAGILLPSLSKNLPNPFNSKVEPTPPLTDKAGILLASLSKDLPNPFNSQVELPPLFGGKAGILLPSLNKVEPPPPGESHFAGFITYDPIIVG